MASFEKTFDNAALDYDKSRPMYAKEIYDDIFNYKQINQDSHVLEIGMGTGKAAQPILDTHCHFVGIEPGEDLAALAKERFKKYENFSLYSQTLQDYECADNSFDLIYAATAFHWIPEEYGYRRVYNLLKKRRRVCPLRLSRRARSRAQSIDRRNTGTLPKIYESREPAH